MQRKISVTLVSKKAAIFPPKKTVQKRRKVILALTPDPVSKIYFPLSFLNVFESFGKKNNF
jgi:hypothetical protein